MKETYIYGFRVKYEDNAKDGVNYLFSDLDRDEARVFFDQAKARKSAKFEDDEDRQFTLSYDGDGSYSLMRRTY